MRAYGVAFCLLLSAARLEAQPAPTIVSTLQTTDTTTSSVKVGCAVGSGTCTGGILFGTASGASISLSGGYLEIQSFVPASQTFRLVNNSGTLQWNGSALAIGGSISGTLNTIPVFTGASSIGNSIMTQSGTTITVATTLNATSLGGLLTTANQTGLTGTGTITSGTWQATKIGLAFGGTNADLSGTGGTSQFLRQNSLGATVTVVRPAISDLSDGTNVALLNAQNVFAAAVAGAGFVQKINNSQAAGAGQFSGLEIDVDNLATSLLLREYSASASPGFTNGVGAQNNVAEVVTGAANGLAFGAIGGSGAIGFYAGGLSQRWGINSAGDFTFGASSHITESNGTPSVSSGFGTSPTIAGTDFAMDLTIGSAANTGGVINFGHTWSTAPVCVLGWSNGGSTLAAVPSITASTTQLTISFVNSTSFSVGSHLYALCRGY